jgi:hypothetical protein
VKPKLVVVRRLPTGHKIVIGDGAGMNRDGWRDKIGMYVGTDHEKKLKVRFDEFGGALLLCYPNAKDFLIIFF